MFKNQIVFPAQAFKLIDARLTAAAAAAIMDGRRKINKGVRPSTVHAETLPAVVALNEFRQIARRSGHVG
jgi:hypothetical protein